MQKCFDHFVFEHVQVTLYLNINEISRLSYYQLVQFLFIKCISISSTFLIEKFDLQLPIPITTKKCDFKSRSRRGVLDTTLSDTVCQ